MHPSQALETWWHCTNAMPELAGCKAVVERLLALPAAVTSTGERECWSRLRAKLPPIPRREVNGRFPAFWGPNYDWTPDQDHGGVLMKAFQSMLLQTDGQQIFLMRAWPKEWDVEFKLHAPRQTIVEGLYRDGRMRSLRVSPESRRADLRIVSP
jgi:hypothetical protein